MKNSYRGNDDVDGNEYQKKRKKNQYEIEWRNEENKRAETFPIIENQKSWINLLKWFSTVECIESMDELYTIERSAPMLAVCNSNTIFWSYQPSPANWMSPLFIIRQRTYSKRYIPNQTHIHFSPFIFNVAYFMWTLPYIFHTSSECSKADSPITTMNAKLFTRFMETANYTQWHERFFDI